ncbi:hypothetical protein [Steroidobacter cummioxidans]|uniref:hypothetical protein n=1 Tax=Steroidobacter cummioxidans TaxID=1803913 RepID=UPI000E30D5C9|nr:hypothetical protein [Steroidobacter cummioxidans]
MRHQKLITVVAMTAALGLISLVHAPSAQAAEEDIPDHPVLRDAWYISGGALYARSNVVASLNKTVIGTLIDFEDDLGLDRYDWMGLWTLRWQFFTKALAGGKSKIFQTWTVARIRRCSRTSPGAI